jgi:predicted adenine nucleotide alpha hydrolase (AANH) superfamily ATPase
LETDWKKDGRQEKGKKMIDERGIYRQNYCGCKFSIKNYAD